MTATKGIYDSSGKRILDKNKLYSLNQELQDTGSLPQGYVMKDLKPEEIKQPLEGNLQLPQNTIGNMDVNNSGIIDKSKLNDISEIKSPVVKDDKGNLSTGFTPLNDFTTQNKISIQDNNFNNSKNNISQSELIKPKNLDEFIDYSLKNPKTNFDEKSIEVIKNTPAYNTLKKYTFASEDSIYSGLKNGELSISGDTWNRLVKIHGGITPEMEKARQKWEQNTKILNTNNTIKILGGKTDLQKTLDKFHTDLQEYDKKFLDNINSQFKNLDILYNQSKQQNSELQQLNSTLNDLSSQIDELNIEKRKVLKDVKKQYPHEPLSKQLAIANNRLQDIDDQLFVLQREYNRVKSDYVYLNQQYQEEFKYKIENANKKMQILQDMYKIGRGDILNNQKILLAEQQLQEERAYKEQQYKQALADKDRERALEYAQELALLDYKAKINNDTKAKMKAFSTTGGLFTFDPNTGDVKFVPNNVGNTDNLNVSIGDVSNSNSSLYDFIKDKEGLLKKATWDNKQYSIGYGFGTINGKPVTKDMWIDDKGYIRDGAGNILSTLDEAFAENLANHQTWQNYIKVGLTPEQKTALTSFEYNLGSNIWKGAGKEIINKINNGDLEGASELMKKFNKVRRGGVLVYNKGLAKRRADEAKLLLNGFTNNIDDELAKNSAVSVFVGETKLPKGINKELVNKYYQRIKDFEIKNKEISDIWSRIVGGGVKASDAEQIKKYKKGIAEFALGEQSKEDILNRIKDELISNPPKGINGRIADALNLNQQINIIEDLFNKAKTKTGFDVKVINELFKSAGLDYGDITSIDQLTGTMLAEYVKSISGTAVTDEEYERLAKQFPNVKDDPKRFKRMLDNFKTFAINKHILPYKKLVGDDKIFYEMFPELKNNTKKKLSFIKNKNQILNNDDLNYFSKKYKYVSN